MEQKCRLKKFDFSSFFNNVPKLNRVGNDERINENRATESVISTAIPEYSWKDAYSEQ